MSYWQWLFLLEWPVSVFYSQINVQSNYITSRVFWSSFMMVALLYMLFIDGLIMTYYYKGGIFPRIYLWTIITVAYTWQGRNWETMWDSQSHATPQTWGYLRLCPRMLGGMNVRQLILCLPSVHTPSLLSDPRVGGIWWVFDDWISVWHTTLFLVLYWISYLAQLWMSHQKHG